METIFLVCVSIISLVTNLSQILRGDSRSTPYGVQYDTLRQIIINSKSCTLMYLFLIAYIPDFIYSLYFLHIYKVHI